jgi:hypothetical protein
LGETARKGGPKQSVNGGVNMIKYITYMCEYRIFKSTKIAQKEVRGACMAISSQRFRGCRLRQQPRAMHRQLKDWQESNELLLMISR